MNSSETMSGADSATALPEDQLWTTKQAANFLQVSARTVFNLWKVGLPYVQLGGTVRFNPQGVRDYLAAHPHLSFHRLRQLARRKAKSS